MAVDGSRSPIARLAARHRSGDVHVVVETPKGRRNKYTYDEEGGFFELGGVLPAGAAFPFDFGFIPKTLGGDGDPLDVLVLMDEPAFPGCVVRTRLVGVIEAEQTEKSETRRNDRLIAVAVESRDHRDVRSLDDLSRNTLDEIEHFFVSYNQIKGKRFEPLGRFGPERADALVREGERRHRRRQEAKPAPDKPGKSAGGDGKGGPKAARKARPGAGRERRGARPRGGAAAARR
jgi:inorganic pyrophosphatase